MNKFSVKFTTLVFCALFIQSLVAQASEGDEDKGLTKTAYLYSENDAVMCDLLDLPYRGDKELVETLSKLELDIFDYVHHYDFDNIKLERAVKFIESLIPDGSKWEFTVSEEVKNIRVSGEMVKNLTASLVNLMRNGGFYCEITHGSITLKSSGNVNVGDWKADAAEGKIKVTQKVTFHNNDPDRHGRDPLAGSAHLYAMPFGPGPYDDMTPASYYFTGNSNLMSAVRDLTIEGALDPKLENITLDEIAGIINLRIKPEDKWSIVVSEDVKNIKTSGALNKSLLITLNQLMRKDQSFGCYITKGQIKFVRNKMELK